MPITRRALLIANPGETGQENYCKGVYVDVRNFRRLLISPHGGAWNDEIEIKTLNRPTKQELARELIHCDLADYSFILFSGHGCFSEELQEPVLELQANVAVPLSKLLEPGTKRTVILDCCQKIQRTELQEAVNFSRAAMEAAQRREPDRAACRRLFDEHINAASTSAVIPQSCSIDEYSTADDTRGSRYAASLVQVADQWASAQAQSWQSGGSCSIVAAHIQAAEMTIRLGAGDQNPTISKAKTGPYFPFAVFG
jgi:Caspase domain